MVCGRRDGASLFAQGEAGGEGCLFLGEGWVGGRVGGRVQWVEKEERRWVSGMGRGGRGGLNVLRWFGGRVDHKG